MFCLNCGIACRKARLLLKLFALNRAKQPMWEGVVTNKLSKECRENKNSDDDTYRTYMEYTTVIRTDTGKEKKITEKDKDRGRGNSLSGNITRPFSPSQWSSF